MAKRGIVMVNTGDGKGKSTAAFGLALRAVGHNKRVIIIQFMKGNHTYGEALAIRQYLPMIRLEQTGTENFVDKYNPEAIDLAEAKRGYEMALEAVSGGQYDLVILDEINVVMDFDLVSVEKVLDLIKAKAEQTDLMLTGRYAPQSIKEAADMVTDMQEVKHHFYAGFAAKEGIEY